MILPNGIPIDLTNPIFLVALTSIILPSISILITTIYSGESLIWPIVIAIFITVLVSISDPLITCLGIFVFNIIGIRTLIDMILSVLWNPNKTKKTDWLKYNLTEEQMQKVEKVSNFYGIPKEYIDYKDMKHLGLNAKEAGFDTLILSMCSNTKYGIRRKKLLKYGKIIQEEDRKE